MLVAKHDLGLIGDLDKPRITLNRGQLILNNLAGPVQEGRDGWQ